MKFVLEFQKGERTLSELCRYFGITRRTGYKWLDRFNQSGVLGLQDASRAPRNHPNAVAPEMEERIIELREVHPRYGPRKLLYLLEGREPERTWPCTSTVGKILKDRGLIPERRRRRRATPSASPFAQCNNPNETWCIDFKGWFCTGDGRRCNPLTITDASSRYLLCCHALPTEQTRHVKSRMELVFGEYGLPKTIRSDNGTPFASTGLAGLSRLSVWWIKLGITPERIRPATPSENGRHERMHLTLKLHTAMPPRDTLRHQQQAFDEFRQEYNELRPHEALEMHTPASCYAPSPVAYQARTPNPEYPQHFIVRPVQQHGQIRFRGRRYFLTEALAGEYVGLEPDDGDNRRFKLHFFHIAIGWLYLSVPHALPLNFRPNKKGKG
jgi:transposase InsO family protein